MRDHVVKKAFNTVNRRLKVGDTVTAADDLHPFTLSDRVDGGFLEMKRDEAAADVPPVAEAAPTARLRGGVKAADQTE